MTLSLQQAKAHLRVDTGEDNDLILEKLRAAAEWVSAYTGAPIPIYPPYPDPLPDPWPPEDDPVVPAPVIEAVLQITAHLYENREATLVGVTAQQLPFGALDLLSPYRAWSF
jgi:hypothetical protein